MIWFAYYSRRFKLTKKSILSRIRLDLGLETVMTMYEGISAADVSIVLGADRDIVLDRYSILKKTLYLWDNLLGMVGSLLAPSGKPTEPIVPSGFTMPTCELAGSTRAVKNEGSSTALKAFCIPKVSQPPKMLPFTQVSII